VAPVDGWLPSVLSIAYNMQMQANAVKRMNIALSMRWVTASAMAAAALVLAIGSLRRAFDRLVVAMDAAVPEPAFLAVAEIVAAAGGCWLAVGTLCVLLGETPWRGSGSTRRLGRRCVPRCWRAGVLAVVGTGLLAGPALASAAGTQTRPPADQHTHQPRGALGVLDGLVLPDRASGGWHGRSTVVVALALYSLTILVRNIVAGLDAVPDDVVDAATGMGFGRNRMLWRVQVPLALPAVFAGLRVATVSTIALTTIGFLVGFGGLGNLISDGFTSNFRPQVLLAAALCVVLAVAADLLLLALQKSVTPWARGARA